MFDWVLNTPQVNNFYLQVTCESQISPEALRAPIAKFHSERKKRIV